MRRVTATVVVLGGMVIGTPAVEAANDCTIIGTEGDDWLVGTEGDDVICGFGGDDVLDGVGGSDELRGGPGQDTLLGGAGQDILRGGPDADVLDGQGGADHIIPGSGKDWVISDPEDSFELDDSGGLIDVRDWKPNRARQAIRGFENSWRLCFDTVSESCSVFSASHPLLISVNASAAEPDATVFVDAPPPLVPELPPLGPPSEDDIDAAVELRSELALDSDRAIVANLFALEESNPSRRLMGAPLSDAEWDDFTRKQLVLSDLTDFVDMIETDPAYRSVYWDYAGKGTLHVRTTSLEAVRGVDRSVDSAVVFEQAPLSLSDVRSMVDQLVIPAFVGHGIDSDGLEVTVDPVTDAIEVVVYDPNFKPGQRTNSPKAALASTAASEANQSLAAAGGGLSVTSRVDAPPVEAIEEWCQQWGQSACHPVGGSLAIGNTTDQQFCTSGPAVRTSGGDEGVLTAAHCEVPGAAPFITRVGETPANAHTWAARRRYDLSNGHDEMFVDVINNADVMGTQYVSPNAHHLLVNRHRRVVVGEIVCHSGQRSFSVNMPRSRMCGQVTNLGAIGGGTQPITSTMDACEGDSGGTVYSLRRSAWHSLRVDVNVVGLIVTGIGTQYGLSGAPCFSQSRFVDVRLAMNTLGLTLITQIGERGGFERTLVDMYGSVLGRTGGPDWGGFNYWMNQHASVTAGCHSKVNVMIWSHLASNEYRARGGRNDLTQDWMINNRIKDAYRAALHRTPPSSVVGYWRGQVKLAGGTDAVREAQWNHVAWAIAVSSDETQIRRWTRLASSGQPAKCQTDMDAASYDPI